MFLFALLRSVFFVLSQLNGMDAKAKVDEAHDNIADDFYELAFARFRHIRIINDLLLVINVNGECGSVAFVLWQ